MVLDLALKRGCKLEILLERLKCRLKIHVDDVTFRAERELEMSGNSKVALTGALLNIQRLDTDLRNQKTLRLQAQDFAASGKCSEIHASKEMRDTKIVKNCLTSSRGNIHQNLKEMQAYLRTVSSDNASYRAALHHQRILAKRHTNAARHVELTRVIDFLASFYAEQCCKGEKWQRFSQLAAHAEQQQQEAPSKLVEAENLIGETHADIVYMDQYDRVYSVHENNLHVENNVLHIKLVAEALRKLLTSRNMEYNLQKGVTKREPRIEPVTDPPKRKYDTMVNKGSESPTAGTMNKKANADTVAVDDARFDPFAFDVSSLS